MKISKAEWTLADLLPGAIEASEKRGQSKLVHSEQLPTKIYGYKAVLEVDGVVFGEPTEEDPIFCPVTLPEGWEKRPTEHSMWSDLVDNHGNVRARIFYKDAFYDRSAHMEIANQDESDRADGNG